MENEIGIFRGGKGKDISTVVNIPNPIYEAMEGKYFIGTTHTLFPNQFANAWGALINPRDSGVNFYLNTFTVTNSGEIPLVAQAWMNAFPPGKGEISKKVSPTNTAAKHLHKPKVEIFYARQTHEVPCKGVHIFDRIATPEATLVDEKDGKIIIQPGGTFLVFLVAPFEGAAAARIAFGWWEDKVKCK